MLNTLVCERPKTMCVLWIRISNTELYAQVTKLEDPKHHQTLAVAIATEVAIMSTMNHVNIVKVFDVINDVYLRDVIDRIRGDSLLHKSIHAFGKGLLLFHNGLCSSAVSSS